jgi:hypothetical protein
MSTNIYIRPGGWVSNKLAVVKGSLDLRKFVRDILLTFNVPAYDSTAATVTAGQPVKVNSAGLVQTFNGTAWVTAPVANMVAVPATATSTGIAGQVAYDATHFYVCIATNTWIRAVFATF